MTAETLLTSTIASKEDYDIWRSEWKRVYLELSEDIRIIKLLHKNVRRAEAARDRTSTDEAYPLSYAAKLRLAEAFSRDRAGFGSQRELATALLARRRQSKVEAQRLYTESVKNRMDRRLAAV